MIIVQHQLVCPFFELWPIEKFEIATPPPTIDLILISDVPNLLRVIRLLVKEAKDEEKKEHDCTFIMTEEGSPPDIVIDSSAASDEILPRSSESGTDRRDRVPSILLPQHEDGREVGISHASIHFASPTQMHPQASALSHEWLQKANEHHVHLDESGHHPYQEPPFAHMQPASPNGRSPSVFSESSHLRGHTGSTILREGVASLARSKKKGDGETKWYGIILDLIEPGSQLLRQLYKWGTEHERLTILVSFCIVGYTSQMRLKRQQIFIDLGVDLIFSLMYIAEIQTRPYMPSEPWWIIQRPLAMHYMGFLFSVWNVLATMIRMFFVSYLNHVAKTQKDHFRHHIC